MSDTTKDLAVAMKQLSSAVGVVERNSADYTLAPVIEAAALVIANAILVHAETVWESKGGHR